MCADRRPGRDGGFTLLEVLVAVAILSILLGLIPRSFVYARAIINRSESWTEARLVAESVMNGEISGHGLTPGTRRGVLDGRPWTATFERNRTLSVPLQGSGRILMDVRLSVAVSADETLVVDTMRIGAAQ
jgi:prepilin-type N-terminal cleavage/methylation domain-containing protein